MQDKIILIAILRLYDGNSTKPGIVMLHICMCICGVLFCDLYDDWLFLELTNQLLPIP